MLAMLYAQKIILDEGVTFADVPAKLKDKVAKILIESGFEDLVK